MKRRSLLFVCLSSIAALTSCTGVNGVNGKDGIDGKSAYQIYCENHPEYTGTEKEWIDSFCSNKTNDYIGKIYYTVYEGKLEYFDITKTQIPGRRLYHDVKAYVYTPGVLTEYSLSRSDSDTEITYINKNLISVSDCNGTLVGERFNSLYFINNEILTYQYQLNSSYRDGYSFFATIEYANAHSIELKLYE